MKGATTFASCRPFFAIVALLAIWLLALPLRLNAQNTCSGTSGQNGVYNPTCNNRNPGVVGSPAFMQAMRLLAEGAKVTHAALESGYSTPSAFISMFRRTLGTTPSLYFRADAKGK
jgi:hypothetical protein